MRITTWLMRVVVITLILVMKRLINRLCAIKLSNANIFFKKGQKAYTVIYFPTSETRSFPFLTWKPQVITKPTSIIDFQIAIPLCPRTNFASAPWLRGVLRSNTILHTFIIYLIILTEQLDFSAHLLPLISAILNNQ